VGKATAGNTAEENWCGGVRDGGRRHRGRAALQRRV